MTASTPRPHYCNPAAYELFAESIVDLEKDGNLLRAAVGLAMHEMPEVDVQQVEHEIDGLAAKVLARVHSDDPKALLTHAHEVLFIDEDFLGDVDDYHNPQNSYIPAVLARRRGLPITLGLLYKEVLERVGLSVEGCNAPGHFLCSVWCDSRPMLVDTFTRGRILSRSEAYARMEQMVGPLDAGRDYLRRASGRAWLARILQNLMVRFGETRQQRPLAAMLELQGLLEQQQTKA